MMVDIITAVAQLALCAVLIGYTIHVLRKWSKLADEISGICESDKIEIERAKEAANEQTI